MCLSVSFRQRWREELREKQKKKFGRLKSCNPEMSLWNVFVDLKIIRRQIRFSPCLSKDLHCTVNIRLSYINDAKNTWKKIHNPYRVFPAWTLPVLGGLERGIGGLYFRFRRYIIDYIEPILNISHGVRFLFYWVEHHWSLVKIVPRKQINGSKWTELFQEAGEE